MLIDGTFVNHLFSVTALFYYSRLYMLFTTLGEAARACSHALTYGSRNWTKGMSTQKVTQKLEGLDLVIH